MNYTTTEQLYSIFLQHPQVCTDTRNIPAGSIFFALKGGNFNGNHFASEAISKGASFAVVDEEAFATNEKTLLVADVLKALQDLARHHRRTLNLPVLAITGSNGKTTTKELVAAVLAKKYCTLYTKGNLNNHIGVPLTLLSLTKEHEVAVVEMGANHQREIAELCAIAEPDFGLITNVGLAHLEGFGGPEGVLKGKTEMFDHLRSANGTALVFADDDRLILRSEGMHTITYGCSEKSAVRGKLLHADPFVAFEWKTANETHEVQTRMIGAYNLPNMLAAVASGILLKVDSKAIGEAIASYVPEMNRSQIVHKNSNTIVMDAYNANPSSMKAAIENFAAMPGEKKWIILGDMFELGEASAKEHQQVVDLIAAKKFDRVILAGKHFAAANSIQAELAENAEAASDLIRSNSPQNTTILIKGSRGMKLEKVLEAL